MEGTLTLLRANHRCSHTNVENIDRNRRCIEALLVTINGGLHSTAISGSYGGDQAGGIEAALLAIKKIPACQAKLAVGLAGVRSTPDQLQT